jgi:hypothetical protein
MCPIEPKAAMPREWFIFVMITEREIFLFFSIWGRFFLHVMIADLREEHEEIFSC